VTGDFRLRWQHDTLVPTTVDGRPFVVDSWLVDDGRVRAFERHVRRFADSCACMAGLSEQDVTAFMTAVAARIPTDGRWFPRVELIDGRLEAWIRPAPQRGERVRLWIYEGRDRRTVPTVKGPDLDHLLDLRSLAITYGADEAVIRSPRGDLLEGSTTSLMWWRDNTLCTPAGMTQLLPSVTSSLLVQWARADGFAVQAESVTPAELNGLEVWAVNALHGVRPVTAWVNADSVPGPATRARQWQARLDAAATTAPTLSRAGSSQQGVTP
jgi:branched-subunit amino acid aminotransferase/4-amino-4-deoxychorismate lyase